jgi:hypothetical protein
MKKDEICDLTIASPKVSLQQINARLEEKRKIDPKTFVFVSQQEFVGTTGLEKIVDKCENFKFYFGKEGDIGIQGGLGLKIIPLSTFQTMPFVFEKSTDNDLIFKCEKYLKDISFAFFPNRFYKFDSNDFEKNYIDLIDAFGKIGKIDKDLFPIYGQSSASLYIIKNDIGIDTGKDFVFENNRFFKYMSLNELRKTIDISNFEFQYKKLILKFPDNSNPVLTFSEKLVPYVDKALK